MQTEEKARRACRQSRRPRVRTILRRSRRRKAQSANPPGSAASGSRHLMKLFARAGNRVMFVNSTSMGLPGLTNKDLLPRIARKLRSYSKLARTTPEGITVVSPAALPFFGNRPARAVNRKLLAAQLGK